MMHSTTSRWPVHAGSRFPVPTSRSLVLGSTTASDRTIGERHDPYPPSTQSAHYLHYWSPWPWWPLPCLSRLAAPGTVIYDSQPNPLPGNLLSHGLPSQQTSEFGDQIIFAAGPRGAWHGERGVLQLCVPKPAPMEPRQLGSSTTPGRDHFNPPPNHHACNIYEVDATGPTLGRRAHSRRSPRPWRSRSVLRPISVNCARHPKGAPGGWLGPPVALCHNGFAFPVEFAPRGVRSLTRSSSVSRSTQVATANPPVGAPLGPLTTR